jgi:hypothetical protein
MATTVVMACSGRALADFGFPPPENLTTTQGIVRGAVVTLVVELLIVVSYCRRHALPKGGLLLAGLIGNALTLPVVWFCSVLGWFFLAFVGVLVFALVELLAAMIEGLLYRWIGRLRWPDAIRLALIANAVTAALGLVDQVLHMRRKERPPGDGRVTTSRPLQGRDRTAWHPSVTRDEVEQGLA